MRKKIVFKLEWVKHVFNAKVYHPLIRGQICPQGSILTYILCKNNSTVGFGAENCIEFHRNID